MTSTLALCAYYLAVVLLLRAAFRWVIRHDEPTYAVQRVPSVLAVRVAMRQELLTDQVNSRYHALTVATVVCDFIDWELEMAEFEAEQRERGVA